MKALGKLLLSVPYATSKHNMARLTPASGAQVVESLRRGMSVTAAAEDAIRRIAKRYPSYVGAGAHSIHCGVTLRLGIIALVLLTRR